MRTTTNSGIEHPLARGSVRTEEPKMYRLFKVSSKPGYPAKNVE
jgi:hypothetical protein